jgi:transcriptional regulator with XRE-family HTH domain
MPASMATRFGILLRETRKREGLSQTQLAGYLSISKSKASKLEAGRSAPPADPAFYDRLRAVRGFNVVDITRLQVVAEYDRSIEDLEKPRFDRYSNLITDVKVGTEFRQLVTNKVKAQDALTHLLPYDIRSDVSILSREVLNVLKDLERPSPIQPDTGELDAAASQGVAKEALRAGSQPEQRRRVRKKDVVFQRTRTHYDRDYLEENPQNVLGLVFDAVKSNDPDLSPAAEQVLQSIHVIAESVAKTKGKSLSQVSREHHISISRLSDFVRKGLIPPLYKDRNTIYVANETAQELGNDKQDAEEMGMQLARLLRERRNKYFPQEPKS